MRYLANSDVDSISSGANDATIVSDTGATSTDDPQTAASGGAGPLRKCTSSALVGGLLRELLCRASEAATVDPVIDNAAIARAWVWEQIGYATPPENFHRCPLCVKWLLNREQMVFHAIRRCVLGPANRHDLPTEERLVTYITDLLSTQRVSNTVASRSATFDCPWCTEGLSRSQIDEHFCSVHRDELSAANALREITAGSSLACTTIFPEDFDITVCPLCRCEPSACEAADFVSTNRWVERHVWYDCPLGPRMRLDFRPSPRSSQGCPSKDAMKAMLRGVVLTQLATVGESWLSGCTSLTALDCPGLNRLLTLGKFRKERVAMSVRKRIGQAMRHRQRRRPLLSDVKAFLTQKDQGCVSNASTESDGS